jgi:hypothetical protein
MEKFSLLTLVLIISIFNACSKSPTSVQDSNNTQYSNVTVLGNKINDPYTTESMSKALNTLINEKMNSKTLAKRMAPLSDKPITLRPNYLYVKFLPKGKMQDKVLKRYDSTLVLFPYPLDYEFVQKGVEYIDPSIEDSVKAYYAAVPISYIFPDSIKYELLKELFLVEPIIDSLDSLIEKSGGALAKVASLNDEASVANILAYYDITPLQLELMALQITGNLEKRIAASNVTASTIADISLAKTAGLLPTRWRPSGRVTFADTRLGTQPLAGVRITAGYSYYWRSSRTNSNGNFSSPETWLWSVEYQLHWDADDFLLEDGSSLYGADLWEQGPTRKSSWNPHYTGKQAALAIIFTAAWDYYYGNIDGLNRPHQNDWFSISLDFQIYDKAADDYQGVQYVVPWFAEWLEIYLKYKSNGQYLVSEALYGTTIHELAHSAHYANFETRYTWTPRDIEWSEDISDAVQETFARGVQWSLTRKRYLNYEVSSYSGNYKGIIQDLIDNDTTYALSSTNGDIVSGFTISQIEKVVLKSFSLSELKDKLKSVYPNGTSGISYTNEGMDALFTYWEGK